MPWPHGWGARLQRPAESREELERERASARALRTTLAAQRERQPIARPASDAPQSVLEAVERAQAMYADALRILPSTVAAARESEFPDYAMTWQYLKALGEVGRRRQDHALSRPLGEVFADLGVEFTPGPTDPTKRTPYLFRDGDRDIECPDQLRKGSNPNTCLRIYFADGEDGGFVIGHVGRQIDVRTLTGNGTPAAATPPQGTPTVDAAAD